MPSTSTPCLVITPAAIAEDPAHQTGGRGARKHVVTTLYRNEREATDPIWHHPGNPDSAVPVIVSDQLEVASFNHTTPQDRHRHPGGIEVYTVIRGIMRIWVEGEVYVLTSGDTIVIKPGVLHEVLRETEFLCMVYTCKGGTEKEIAPP